MSEVTSHYEAVEVAHEATGPASGGRPSESFQMDAAASERFDLVPTTQSALDARPEVPEASDGVTMFDGPPSSSSWTPEVDDFSWGDPPESSKIVRDIDTVEGPRSPGEDLAHKISRVAVAYPASESAAVTHPTVTSHVEDYGYRVQRGGEVLPEDINRTADTDQKNEDMKAVNHQLSIHALRNITTGEHRADANIDWGGVAQSLAVGALVTPDAEPHIRDQKLVAGVIASKFADTDADRVKFLRTIYDHGLAAETATACAQSPLSIVHDAPGATWSSDHPDHTHEHHRLEALASIGVAFQADPEVAQEYLNLLQSKLTDADDATPAEAGEPLPSSKKIMRTLSEHPADSPMGAEVHEQARKASTTGPKVGGGLYDPTKIERFGLQGLFIHDQAEAFFGTTGEDIKNSPFAKALAATRDNERAQSPVLPKLDPFDGELVKQINQIETDVTAAFKATSEPVVDRYSTVGADPATSDPSTLTQEQRRSLRYQAVRKVMVQQKEISKFVLGDRLEDRIENELDLQDRFDDSEVYSISRLGGDAPQSASVMLLRVIKGAQKLYEKSGKKPEPEEILEVLQTNRRTMLQNATQNVAELAQGIKQGLTIGEVTLTRDEAGNLQAKVASGTMPAKGSLDMYAAQTLGCPALHEINGARKTFDVLEKITYGSANFIDHALAAVYREVYNRGMLDLDRYYSPTS